MNNYSILQNLKPEHIHLNPWPHIIIPEAPPVPLFRQLKASLPNERPSKTAHIGHARFDLSASEMLKFTIPDVLKAFLDYHTSSVFFGELHSVFGRAGFVDSDFRIWKGLAEVGRRGNSGGHTILMECQFSGNRSGDIPGTPIGPHIDSANSYYAGLLYLRDEDDHTPGGDLQLYRWRQDIDGRGRTKILKKRRTNIGYDEIELIKVIPYSTNLLVLFPNSRNAIHAVSLREPTNYERLFFNFGADLTRITLYQSHLSQSLIQLIQYLRNKWRAREDSNFQPSDP